jgi:hypothetical protein
MCADRDWRQWKLAISESRDPSRCLRNALDALADPKNTEVYIKGKWEGITGKYTVVTVAPEATNLIHAAAGGAVLVGRRERPGWNGQSFL